MSALSQTAEPERRRRLLGNVLLITAGIAALHLAVNAAAGGRPLGFYVLLISVVLAFGVLRARLTAHNADRYALLYVYFSVAAVWCGGLLDSQMLPYVAGGGLVVILLAGAMVGVRAALLVGAAMIAMEITVMIAGELGWAPRLEPAKNVILILETATAAGLVALLARDRARAVEAMLGEQQRLAEIIEQSPDVLLTVSEAGQLLAVSPAISTLLGVPPDTLLGRTLEQTPLAPLGNLGEEGAREHWLTRASGERVAVERNARRVVTQAGETVWRASLRDVTRRLEAEAAGRSLTDQLHHAQRLEAVGRLAGGVAHDFNNLLTVIIGSSAELQEVSVEPEERKELADEIAEAAQRAAELTRQLLQFSRRDHAEPVVFDVGLMVPELVRLLQRMLGEQVALSIDVSDLPCRVEMDRGQLEQVLINLAVNARDAMPSGGTLQIAVKPTTHGTVHIAVQDDGDGIPADLLPRIFEPFYTTKSAAKGTGLGLAVCHGIVTAVDGSIAATSRSGEGTCFDIELPRTRDAATIDRKSGEFPPLSGKDLRVLVIDDEQLVLQTVVRVLQGGGYDVVTATTLELAVAALAAGPVDVVLSDVMLPGQSGPEIVAVLEERFGPQRVVFMSGYPGGVLAPTLAQRPDLTLLPKPFSKRALLAAVSDVLTAAPTQAPVSAP